MSFSFPKTWSLAEFAADDIWVHLAYMNYKTPDSHKHVIGDSSRELFTFRIQLPGLQWKRSIDRNDIEKDYALAVIGLSGRDVFCLSLGERSLLADWEPDKFEDLPLFV